MGTIPGPVEILRAAQKDNIFIDRFGQNVQEVVEALLGRATSLKWRTATKVAAVGAYFSLTNLAGFQTLGEEYAGLVQTDSSRRRGPSKKMIASMILLHTCGHSLLEQSLQRLGDFLYRHLKKRTTEIHGESNDAEEPLEKNTSHSVVLKLTQGLRHCLPFLLQLHLVIFYIQGKFYHLSKRFSGIHYVLVRAWFANQDENSQKNLKYLRMMSVINLILTAFHDSVQFINSQKQSDKKKVLVKPSPEESLSGCDATTKCSLCLEVRKNPCLTPCGHLFCWECIMDWLQTKEECPICRTECSLSRVVPLQNHF